jgi:hypothetical protein
MSAKAYIASHPGHTQRRAVILERWHKCGPHHCGLHHDVEVHDLAGCFNLKVMGPEMVLRPDGLL